MTGILVYELVANYQATGSPIAIHVSPPYSLLQSSRFKLARAGADELMLQPSFNYMVSWKTSLSIRTVQLIRLSS